jgi:hypothetical protein
MKRNIGKLDKTIRIVLGAIGIATFFWVPLPAVWSYVILGSSGIMLLTAFMNWCPMCAIAGKSTCEISPS